MEEFAIFFLVENAKKKMLPCDCNLKHGTGKIASAGDENLDPHVSSEIIGYLEPKLGDRSFLGARYAEHFTIVFEKETKVIGY